MGIEIDREGRRTKFTSEEASDSLIIAFLFGRVPYCAVSLYTLLQKLEVLK